ncbi:type II toxin-antitoxin system RelE/ParE family toxin [Klebsiella michiganensis]|uniref:type II toxin-antitoxin system RelE/ParE family toxin n=1 Tax=Klebsiella michiganensis TaxID=1134687 RepID=UPI0015F3EDBE|nr:type II toxin-antitoxin system RelE/ParE family toxin [Klebsiella michiganensis]MBA7864014.1 type II toxin-antitoxin system RelE/ParE family toxin [Klebsiella michiganensis]MBL0774721.1 type II toxin-antitoxin system RelE/ParE family toxin [Klebsiella michiganensis]
MSEEQQGQEIDVYQSRRFEKSLSKLPEAQLKIVEDEIDRVINDPLMGEMKKGDLNFLRVHKFQLNNQQVLLGYSWVEDKLELYLLSIGPHENFYTDQKKHRKADLKLIG